MSLILYCIF